MAINLKADNKYEEQIKKLFFLFLKKKKCFDAYVYYSDLARKGSSFSFSPKYPMREGHALLTDAFSWERTNEGYKFWYSLSIEWENILRHQITAWNNEVCIAAMKQYILYTMK